MKVSDRIVLISSAVLWTLISSLQIGSIIHEWKDLGTVLGAMLFLAYVLSIGWVWSKTKQ